MENAVVTLGHKVTLVDREQLEITGVEEVESFDENAIMMSTTQGDLTIRGEGLRIKTLLLEGGALKVSGTVESLTYEDRGPDKGGFWSRLFR